MLIYISSGVKMVKKVSDNSSSILRLSKAFKKMSETMAVMATHHDANYRSLLRSYKLELDIRDSKLAKLEETNQRLNANHQEFLYHTDLKELVQLTLRESTIPRVVVDDIIIVPKGLTIAGKKALQIANKYGMEIPRD